jgi:hypothetical protein
MHSDTLFRTRSARGAHPTARLHTHPSAGTLDASALHASEMAPKIGTARSDRHRRDKREIALVGLMLEDCAASFRSAIFPN